MQDWNQLYEKGETPWDKGIHTPVLDDLLKKMPQFFKGRVLVPGCGIGHDARRLAAHGCEVVALDIAPLAIERAKQADTEHRVDFRLANLFELPEDLRGSFDLVWEHTCLCALDPSMREKYIAAIRAALKPGGKIAGVFYMNPDMEPGESGPPFGITLDELIALWKTGGFEVDEHWVPEVAYNGRIGRERFMRLKRVPIPRPPRPSLMDDPLVQKLLMCVGGVALVFGLYSDWRATLRGLVRVNIDVIFALVAVIGFLIFKRIKRMIFPNNPKD